jgi:hypothetical protein
MINQKSLVLIVATIMLFSFAAVPPANAFIATATIAAILAAIFTSAVVIDGTVTNSKDESIPEHSASKNETQDNLHASNQP